jgi:hypothetical protein
MHLGGHANPVPCIDGDDGHDDLGGFFFAKGKDCFFVGLLA